MLQKRAAARVPASRAGPRLIRGAPARGPISRAYGRHATLRSSRRALRPRAEVTAQAEASAPAGTQSTAKAIGTQLLRTASLAARGPVVVVGERAERRRGRGGGSSLGAASSPHRARPQAAGALPRPHPELLLPRPPLPTPTPDTPSHLPPHPLPPPQALTARPPSSWSASSPRPASRSPPRSRTAPRARRWSLSRRSTSSSRRRRRAT